MLQALTEQSGDPDLLIPKPQATRAEAVPLAPRRENSVPKLGIFSLVFV